MVEVSVIIPTYNCSHYLVNAIDSVLAQSFQDFEILVVDDGSFDETPAVMRRYGPPLRYIRQANGGVARARNRGIAESRGRYVAFLDADDTWYPYKLERQLAALKAYPGHGVCYSDYIVVDSALIPITDRHESHLPANLESLLTCGNVVGSICTVLAERTLFDEVGGFDPELSQCADWDMWVRLALRSRYLYIDEPLATYRQHATNMSRSVLLLEKDSHRVLQKGFSMRGLSDRLKTRERSAFARNYMVLAGSYFRAGSYGNFARCAARALLLDLRQAAYLLAYPVRRLMRRRRSPASSSKPHATT